MCNCNINSIKKLDINCMGLIPRAGIRAIPCAVYPLLFPNSSGIRAIPRGFRVFLDYDVAFFLEYDVVFGAVIYCYRKCRFSPLSAVPYAWSPPFRIRPGALTSRFRVSWMSLILFEVHPGGSPARCVSFHDSHLCAIRSPACPARGVGSIFLVGGIVSAPTPLL